MLSAALLAVACANGRAGNAPFQDAGDVGGDDATVQPGDATTSSGDAGTDDPTECGAVTWTSYVGYHMSQEQVRHVALGDLDGDGRPDLCSTADYGISVRLNNTSPGATMPSFGTNPYFGVGRQVRGPLAVTDLNADGRLDVAAVNAPQGISVLLNLTVPGGPLAMSSASQFATGEYWNAIAAADLNGDSRPDLAIVKDHTVSVLLNTTIANNDSPSFAVQTPLVSSHVVTTIEAGDLNGDGRLDLVGVARDGTISVFVNTTAPGAASSSFAAAVDFVATSTSDRTDLALGDLNADGKIDVAVVGDFHTNVHLLLNTTSPGAATPTFAAAVGFLAGSDPEMVAIGDVNHDGNADLVTTASNGTPTPNISVLLNTAPPGAPSLAFSAPSYVAVSLWANNVAIGDLNDDGRNDLAVATRGNGQPVSCQARGCVNVLLNQCTP